MENKIRNPEGTKQELLFWWKYTEKNRAHYIILKVFNKFRNLDFLRRGSLHINTKNYYSYLFIYFYL